ncbi:hypothetical protein FB451DRAFT_1019738 [Mycena latifolia]|nr:hypothetical protein FB451DRAFT_1019738 [Mycena latifolia]
MSTNGKPFRIGYPTTNSEHLTETSQSTRGDTWYSVVWPVGDSSWKDVTNVPQLTQYALYEQSQPRLYTYALDVYLTNTGFGTTYVFKDQAGDEYLLTALTNGKHSLDFDSEEPNIGRVKTDQEF